jgi:hypothetical protein
MSECSELFSQADLFAFPAQGGREVDGVLKGFDKLDNLVLDDCVEFIRGMCMLSCGAYVA